MSIQEHSVIIHYNGVPCHDDSLHHSTTMNGEILHTCEAQENGVPCWHHADVLYTTSEGIDRHLCKQCYRRMWEIILGWHDTRVETRLQEQGGQVA
jgi:hypothetical protein